MTTEEVLDLVHEDPDFIYIGRFEYSLEKLLERYPDGAPTRIIAQALMITPEDVERIYAKIVRQLQRRMGV